MLATAFDRLEHRRDDGSLDYTEGRDLRVCDTPDGLVEVSAMVGDARMAISYLRLAPGESVRVVRRAADPAVN